MELIVITPIDHIPGVMDKLNKLGKVHYHPAITKKKLTHILKNNNITILYTNPNKQGFILDESILKSSKIEVIATASTGTNHIDKTYISEKTHIRILSLEKELETINKIPCTAEHALGLTISLIRNYRAASNSVLKGKWDWEPHIGRQLSDLTVGVIGYGRLGSKYAHYVSSMGAKVMVYDVIDNCPPDGHIANESYIKEPISVSHSRKSNVPRDSTGLLDAKDSKSDARTTEKHGDLEQNARDAANKGIEKGSNTVDITESKGNGARTVGVHGLQSHWTYKKARDIKMLTSQSDVISLHIHDTPSTQNLIDSVALEDFKKGSYLINTSRSAIVNESAVMNALSNGTLAGYGADVIDGELTGNIKGSPIWKGFNQGKYNIICTPHIGGSTSEGQFIAYSRMCEMVREYLSNEFLLSLP